MLLWERNQGVGVLKVQIVGACQSSGWKLWLGAHYELSSFLSLWGVAQGLSLSLRFVQACCGFSFAFFGDRILYTTTAGKLPRTLWPPAQHQWCLKFLDPWEEEFYTPLAQRLKLSSNLFNFDEYHHHCMKISLLLPFVSNDDWPAYMISEVIRHLPLPNRCRL